MKATKKFVAGALATAMALAVNVPAFAATITINNAAAGETYTAYKLFDVTHGEGATDSPDDDTYSYFTTNETLKNLLDAATMAEDGFDINFTQAAGEKVWYVSNNLGSALGDELAKYIHDNWAQVSSVMGSGIPASYDEESHLTTIDTENETGYYYVTSTLGSLCALNTVTAAATVNEKNTIPTIDKKVKEDSASAGQEWQDTATVDTIDTIYYQLTVNTGTNVANLGTGVNGDYTITDVLPTGIIYNDGTVAFNGSWTIGTDYTVDYEGNTLTIILKQAKLATLAANTNIIITYDAKASTTLTPKTAYDNTVTLSYKEQTDTDKATIKTYQIKGDETGSLFTKVDGTNDNKPLAGVKFVLSKGGKYATFNTDGYLTGWVDTIDTSCKLTTDSNGHIKAYGLDADTYILTETDPLPGYNALNDTITVVIDPDGNVSYQYTSEVGKTEEGKEDNENNTITVVNYAGAQLPSTGGMGTTVLYIAGIVLVLGAGVTLVVRRRMNQDR